MSDSDSSFASAKDFENLKDNSFASSGQDENESTLKQYEKAIMV